MGVYKDFKERTTPVVMKGLGSLAVEGLHSGPLLASAARFVVLWDWESGEIVRRIDVEAKTVSASIRF